MLHHQWMQEAHNQALIAQSHDEVPIGAVLIVNDSLVSKSYNQTLTQNDPTAHAEILCIREAASILSNHRIANATLYITLEPCIMCYGAIVQARIDHVVFAASDPKSGVFTQPKLSHHLNLNHHPNHTKGILEKESTELLKQFFKQRR